MTYDNSMTVEFMSLSVNESFGRMTAAAFASQLDPTIEELADIRTAISEAVTNAIIHGYRKKAGTVVISGTIKGRVLTFTVSDAGEGIDDVDLARQPFYTSMPGLERSGMGFSVMEAFMDSVEVTSEKGAGTTVVMKKLIARNE